MYRKVVILVLLTCVVHGQYRARDVETDQGVVRGYTVDDDNIFSFYGIPYASVPKGQNRFKAPLPPPKWTGVFNATERHITCPQPDTYNFKVIITMDCLRVHVFVPDTKETNLPVVFFIHGGSYQSGLPGMFSPTDIVKRGIIFVNFNYRVGVHGFLCLNNEFAPGNAGMKDQIEALRWVRRNIASFGGNPYDITVAGGSSGSSCVELQILSPVSKRLFTKAISIGGSALSWETVRPEQLKIAALFAEQLGATVSQDVASLETFYRNITDDQLNVRFNPTYQFLVGFTPCVETHNMFGVEMFLTEYPINTLTSGNYQKVSHMSGITDMDGLDFLTQYDTFKPIMEKDFRKFLPGNIEFTSKARALQTTQVIKDFYFKKGDITMNGFAYYYTDTFLAFPQYASARLQAMNSAAVYLFLLSYNGTVNLPSVHSLPLWGPGHATPLLYTQRHIESFVYDNMTREEFILQEKILDLYTNFVKDGFPHSQLVNITWSPVSDKGEYLHMVNEEVFLMEEVPLRERMQIWEPLYNYKYFNIFSSAAASTVSTEIVLCVLINFILKSLIVC